MFKSKREFLWRDFKAYRLLHLVVERATSLQPVTCEDIRVTIEFSRLTFASSREDVKRGKLSFEGEIGVLTKYHATRFHCEGGFVDIDSHGACRGTVALVWGRGTAHEEREIFRDVRFGWRGADAPWHIVEIGEHEHEGLSARHLYDGFMERFIRVELQ